MIPYAGPLYFSILVYPVVLSLGLGLAGWLSWRWVLAINVALLLVQFPGLFHLADPREVGPLGVVVAYAVYQFAVARAFLWRRERGAKGPVFWTAAAIALVPLGVVKVAPDAPAASLLGFLGISYVTFRSLDVIISIQDRLIRSLPAAEYFLFLLFVPTISSGPIDRYNRFVTDLRRTRGRADYLQDLDYAVHLFFRGLLYKFIIASLVKEYWMDPAGARTGVAAIASYMYAYSCYLFFDFAGYSAFAISISRVFGIRTPENFRRPFLAPNIVEFWNRWHISLSMWFRDHVYMRFLMTAMRRRWFSSRLVTSCAAFYVSFGLMGIWHGVSLRYVIYGLYHATLLAGYTLWADYRRRHPEVKPRLPWDIGGIVITFHCVCFGLLIFSGRLG